ncbi:ArsR/SmtB family transcription factor [Cytobacillus sp. Hm23]|uniref:ArsR/SmtB family transcription factor n=1 Tax=Cytobacillus sp. IB215316 TaxID=3097354 RepID=UPI002A11E4D5|nr:metalloregulator ArsR/SmtB family transcription factor [Cytobacillus sp. IB215316]MDX8362791.1 metalloregulator ArsR/SmtB family transcription factor [Cytobacillus sp. IB215316]
MKIKQPLLKGEDKIELPHIEIEHMAKQMKLLGDKTRLSIIALLYHDEFCVCEFVDIFGMSQPAVSQHLRKLKDSGLVKENRKSQWMIYSLNTDSQYYPLIQDMMKFLPDQLEKIKELENKGLRISCK